MSRSKGKPKWESVEMTPAEYMATPKEGRYSLLGFNTIGAATILYEFAGLGQFRIIEWGYHEGFERDRGRVSYAPSLESGNAIYYSIVKTVYGRAWGYGIRQRAARGILAGVQKDVPLTRGRTYDYE